MQRVWIHSFPLFIYYYFLGPKLNNVPRGELLRLIRNLIALNKQAVKMKISSLVS